MNRVIKPSMSLFCCLGAYINLKKSHMQNTEGNIPKKCGLKNEDINLSLPNTLRLVIWV